MDKYADLTIAQLTALESEKRAAFKTLTELSEPTMAQVEEAKTLRAEIEGIIEAKTTAEAAFADLKNVSFDKKEEAPAEEAKTEEAPAEEAPVVTKGASGNAEGEVRTVESPGMVVEPGETAAVETSAVEALAAKATRPDAPQGRKLGGPRLTAAHNVDGFTGGQTLETLTQVAETVLNKAKGFTPPTGDGRSQRIQKFTTSMVTLDYPEELMITDKSSELSIEEAIELAADERRLTGGSLTAAGGWCAPSETVYDLTQDSTTEGMLSLPEVGVRRGGMRFPVSPTFADFYANPGFIQTEAQAIAGTTKPCVEVDCPDFNDVRLDVEGICIKVPILTNVGYPEYVRLFIDESLTAHQHWINANVIGRVVTAAGAARVITGLGSTMADTLEGLELIANQTRQKYRLSLSRTMEVLVPFWVKDMVKSDLRRRTGQLTPVTDQQVQQHFAAAKLNVQWLYDWQPLVETDEVYPATFDVVMYPAGTFVKGTAPVINLGPIYDSGDLPTNVYTGLFTEQGFLVAQRKFHADLVTLPVCNAGRVGAADLTCAVAP